MKYTLTINRKNDYETFEFETSKERKEFVTNLLKTLKTLKFEFSYNTLDFEKIERIWIND